MLWDKLLPIFSSASRFSTHHLSQWLGEVCTTPARCGHGLLPASSTWPRNRPCPRERPNRGISSAFPKTSFPWCPSRAHQKFKVWKSGAWKCSAELQPNTLRGDCPSHSHQSPVLVALFFHSFEWHTKQRPSVVCTSCPTTAMLVSFHLKPWRSRYVLQFSCVRLRRGPPCVAAGNEFALSLTTIMIIQTWSSRAQGRVFPPSAHPQLAQAWCAWPGMAPEATQLLAALLSWEQSSGARTSWEKAQLINSLWR